MCACAPFSPVKQGFPVRANFTAKWRELRSLQEKLWLYTAECTSIHGTRARSLVSLVEEYYWLFSVCFLSLLAKGGLNLSPLEISCSWPHHLKEETVYHEAWNKKLIETDIIVSFNEGHGFLFMNSKLLYLLMFVIASKLIKPSPFTSLYVGSISLNFIFKVILE